MNLLVPALFLGVLLFAAFRRVHLFDAAVEGGREALHTVVGLLPYLGAIFILIALLRASGLTAKLAEWLSPLFSLLGIPKELLELLILRPLSGSGSLVELEAILGEYGPDSYVGRLASVVMGAGDTVLYIAALYFSASKDKRSGSAIVISLIATFLGTLFAGVLCRVI